MIGKLYRLSITLGDKSHVCDNRNGDDDSADCQYYHHDCE